MTTAMIIRTVFEFGLIAFTLWAIFHEDKFAAAEQRLFARFRRRKFKIIDGNRRYAAHPLRDR